MKKKIIAVVAATSLLWGCASVAELAGYNTEQLDKISAQSYAQVREQEKQSIDTSSQTYYRILAVYNRLRPIADQENKTGVAFQWQLTVLRQKVLNAYVLPGGRIVFYTGLVEELKLNNDEIAAIMGHEMTHALLEHTKQRIGQQLLVVGASQAAAVATQSTAVGQTAITLADLGVMKPFSRANETEADVQGLFLMAKAGYNPENAITLWKKMEAYSGGDTSNSILSTHPSYSQRFKVLQDNLPEALKLYQQAIAKRK
ncbi:hypothetical protein CJP74_04795 [Psittacicella melopsittaci]|uniref:Peptidase M48 domain-containing protein n=1 Tax=Psittacicella melopsittaci TaxID=2028576 RepID=A0A3A1Y8A5_9GAMM|nr:hypothetical protein CJP74_04795 [Psittacicella melopsittaci]